MQETAQPIVERIDSRMLRLDRSLIYAALVGGISLAALLLRFYKLGAWSFWGDEISTITKAQGLINYGSSAWSPSLLLMRLVFAWAPVTELNARLVPALLGVIAIPILYFPLRRLFGPAVALVSVLLLAISPWHLYWSQNARYYTSLLLFYTLALLAFYIGIEEDRPGYLLGSLALTGLAAVERLPALMFVPIALGYLGLVWLGPFEKPRGLHWRNLALLVLPCVVGGLFFALPFIQRPAEWWAIFGQPQGDPFWLLAGVIYYVRIPTVCMGALGALYLLQRGSRAALLLSLSAVVPLLAIMVIALFQYVANRYAFVSLTSWTILAGMGVVELVRQTPKTGRLLALGVVLMVVLDPLAEDVLYFKYQNGNRDDHRAAYELIQRERQPGDLVVAADARTGDYYMGEKTIPLEVLTPEEIEGQAARAWIVEDMNVEAKFPAMYHWMQEHARLVANLDVHANARNFKMRVYLYEPARPEAARVSAAEVRVRSASAPGTASQGP